jgi:hypothetical protein
MKTKKIKKFLFWHKRVKRLNQKIVEKQKFTIEEMNVKTNQIQDKICSGDMDVALRLMEHCSMLRSNLCAYEKAQRKLRVFYERKIK